MILYREGAKDAKSKEERRKNLGDLRVLRGEKVLKKYYAYPSS